ncbi:DUF2264 domain-containing protein [Streptomyces sp. NPDC059740]|uniref:DUF2264 domain-containing protein n=1 Tax=Streptomyces sp. NPDC059740 TaxID=3346926 RepID=UPI003667C0F8
MPAPHLPLPPTDRVRSPRTGWTRAHWEAVADHLLASVAPYATPGAAQYRLPGRASWSGVVCDGLEGYARTFLLAAFRVAGARGAVDPLLLERYARGLDAGTDPASGESWPALTDCSQQMVEAASVAVGLHETRPWIWDRLDARVQERVVDWFSGFVSARTWDNNWRLFQVVAEQFLASVGAPHSRADIEGGLERIEDWYVGDGWYTDGDGRNFDYYGGWALHLYPLLWARIAGPEDGGRAQVYRERLSLFLRDYPRFFGGDGAPVHQGRSLAYRFAALAPVWLGALADCSPLAPGLTRRLASGAVRHFMERGVPDERGLLPLGWYDTFLPTTQPYSGPASPYWASKGFLGLLLPADHPVWTERELPLPVEESDSCTALPAPGWLLHATRHDGIVRLVNHGSDHNPASGPAEDDPHYAKFGYSTATAPEAGDLAWRAGLDGHFAVVGADGRPSRRRRIVPLSCRGGTASSRYEAQVGAGTDGSGPGGGAGGGAGAVSVSTTSVVHGPWEVRVHRVTGPHTAVREGGYAVADAAPPQVATGPDWAVARTTAGLASAVVGLYGWGPADADEGGAGVARQVGANAFGSHSATPYLSATGAGREFSVHVTLVALTRDALDPGALRTAVDCEVVGEGAGARVVVRFPDGESAEC